MIQFIVLHVYTLAKNAAIKAKPLEHLEQRFLAIVTSSSGTQALALANCSQATHNMQYEITSCDIHMQS